MVHSKVERTVNVLEQQRAAETARKKSLLRFAESLRKRYGLTPFPKEADPETGRHRPPGYYLQDFFGRNRVRR